MSSAVNPIKRNVYKVSSFPMDIFKSNISHLSDEELAEVLDELKRRYAVCMVTLAQLEAKNKVLKASKELTVTFKRPNKPGSILAIISGNWTLPLELKVIIIESAGGYIENGTTIKTNSPIITLTELNVGNHYGLTIHVTDSLGKRFITTAAFNYTLPDSCRLVKTEFSDTESSVILDTGDDQINQHMKFVLNVLVDKDKIVECTWVAGDNLSFIAEQFLKDNKLKSILKVGLVRLMEQQTRDSTHTKQVDLADLIIV